MTALRFTNAHIVTPQGVIHGSLSAEGGVITDIRHDEGPFLKSNMGIDVEGGYLLPGFIDTQVNGGAGVLFNDSPTVEGIAAIGDAHRAYGTTGFLPALISDELEVIDRAMRAVEDAIAAGVPGVLGIHIEGPFISKDRKGIHDADKFRVLDAESKALLSSLKRGRTMVTVAPERNTLNDIRELTSRGIILAAGHTNATYDEMTAAFQAGITGVTHLYNAMSPLSHRAPGVVGAALDDPDNFCGLIIDGAHVHWAALRIALRARSKDRFMLVTDAMPTVGSPTKRFVLNGYEIVVKDGACVGPDGTLAGSDLDMATGVRNAVQHLDIDIVDAAKLAATNPAGFLGLDDEIGSLRTGMKADVVWLDASLNVRGVYQADGARVSA